MLIISFYPSPFFVGFFLMLVEEIPKLSNANSTTVYFSSSINLTARPIGARFNSSFNNNSNIKSSSSISSSSNGSGGSGVGGSGLTSTNPKGRAKVNYNLNQLFNAQTQTKAQRDSGPSKSAQQIQLERAVQKRLNELNQESIGKSFELPKNFQYNSIHSSGDNNRSNMSHKSRLGNTPATKRILAARRNLNLYYDEERNILIINTILTSNYQFIDYDEGNNNTNKGNIKKQKLGNSRPKLRLCCVCGSKSNYARCSACGLYYCCVRCNNLHLELRCA